jgi:hypothetical protein
MKTQTQPVLVALTLLNLVLLVCLLGQLHPASASPEVAPVLRGRGLQIVDDAGRIRASISVLPASAGTAETVLLRLITERGRPSVKIGASEAEAGLAVVGPTGTEHTYAQLKATQTVSSLKLTDEDGRERVIGP